MSRRAKIICTIGPAVQEPAVLRRLIETGMDVARLNFSHGTMEAHAARIADIREQSQAVGKPVAILQDLQGPKIRTGLLRNGPVELVPGATFVITTDDTPGDAERVSTTYQELPGDVRAGDTILLADGLFELRVDHVDASDVVTRVVHGGTLGEHKGINLPGVQVSAPALTEKDREDLEFGIDQGVDYVALSFVRRAADIYRVKEVMSRKGTQIPIIAKLEKPEAIGRLREIVEVSDGVMVARGDLGVESAPERVPLLQKEIIREANRRGKLVITATQMLESMITNPRPTRAEATDVANAILDGTDAVMLSGETASGRFPLECVAIMDRIARAAEERYADFGSVTRPESVPAVEGGISHAVRGLAEGIGEMALLAIHTRTGRSALQLSKERPPQPIVAFTSDPAALSRMALYWGITPVLMEQPETTDELISQVEQALIERGLIVPGDLVAMVMGSPPGEPASTMKLHRIVGRA